MYSEYNLLMQNTPSEGFESPTPSGAPPSQAAPSTFREFWPLYLSAHSSSTTRALHYVGTFCGLIVFCLTLYLLFAKLSWLAVPAALVMAMFSTYLFAIPSHALFEANKAKTLEAFSKGLKQGSREIWWSILGDLRMTLLFCLGKLETHLVESKETADKDKGTP
jgi:hypothetical protein